MRNFLHRAQRNEVHVLHLFQVIGHYPKTLATAEVGIKEGVGDLIFLRFGCEANQTNFLKIKTNISKILSFRNLINNEHPRKYPALFELPQLYDCICN